MIKKLATLANKLMLEPDLEQRLTCKYLSQKEKNIYETGYLIGYRDCRDKLKKILKEETSHEN